MKMKTMMFSVIAATLLGGVAVEAQDKGKPGGKGESGMMAAEPGVMAAMMDRCKSMMAEHQEEKAGMQAMDDRLGKKLEAMRAASGEKKKLEAMEAVVTELVAQRHEMRERMTAMMPKMMEHMREHMAMSMMQGMQGSAMCPMMKGMPSPGTAQESAKKPADEHSAHH